MNSMQVSHESNNKIILFVSLDATGISNNTNNANGNDSNGTGDVIQPINIGLKLIKYGAIFIVIWYNI